MERGVAGKDPSMRGRSPVVLEVRFRSRAQTNAEIQSEIVLGYLHYLGFFTFSMMVVHSLSTRHALLVDPLAADDHLQALGVAQATHGNWADVRSFLVHSFCCAAPWQVSACVTLLAFPQEPGATLLLHSSAIPRMSKDVTSM